MHVGNLFSALLAWLSARQAGGRIVLRIEDLDTARCRPAYAAQVIDDLCWLGLTFDEGGLKDGPAGSYLQSRRTAYYQEIFAELAKKALVYPCFCSRGELHAASAPHLSDGRTVYAGTCRRLSAEERTRRAVSRPPAWRIEAPDESIGFWDGHYGFYAENPAKTGGDFLLRRSDGLFCYVLAVVADDIAMGVNQVVRGRDLLSATPVQLYLYRLLNAPPPDFYHVPLLVAPDGRRLSKRDGDLDLGALRARFPSPEPLLGRLAFLAGLTDRPEPLAACELIPLFSWDKVPRADIPVSADCFV